MELKHKESNQYSCSSPTPKFSSRFNLWGDEHLIAEEGEFPQEYLKTFTKKIPWIGNGNFGLKQKEEKSKGAESSGSKDNEWSVSEDKEKSDKTILVDIKINKWLMENSEENVLII